MTATGREALRAPRWALTCVVAGRHIEVHSSPGLARQGRWTVVASAHRHSQRLADSTLDAIARGPGPSPNLDTRAASPSLPPVACVVAVHDCSTGALHVTTSVSPGSSVVFGEVSPPHGAGDADRRGAWAVSNHLPSLFTHLGRTPDVDARRLAGFLLGARGNGPVYRGIGWVGRGSSVSLAPGRAPTPRQCFAIEGEPASGSVEEFVEQYCAAIDEVMAAELPASGDVSALMSAGLDSTMVAGTAAKLLAPGRQVFAHCLDPTPAARGTGDIGNWRYTDLPDARAMADLWPSLAVVPLRIAPGETMLEAVPAYVAATGSPVFNPTNAVWMFAGFRSAEARRHEVMLTGQSGNQTFSWEPARGYRALALAGRLGPLVEAMRSRSASLGTSMWWEAGRLAGQLLPAQVQAHVRAGSPWRLSRRMADLSAGDEDGRLASQAFLAPGSLDDLDLRPLAGRSAFRSGRGAPRWWYPGYVGTGVSLPVSPICSVRDCDPLAAEPLVRLVSQLPTEAFLGVADGRSFARRGLRGRAPDRIRLRTARGMQAADARRWFPELEALREMMTWAQNDELLTRVIDVPRLAAAIDARSLDGGAWSNGADRALGAVIFRASVAAGR